MKLEVKALMLALAFSPFSQAATVEKTYNLGAYGVGTDYSQIFTVNRPLAVSGSFGFSNFLNFTITEPLFAGSTVTELQIGSLIDISNLQASIFQGSCDTLTNVCSGSPTVYAPLTPVSDGFLELSKDFAAGNYYVKVTGDVSGSVAGKYTIAATTLPVPEPETWAMLLTGLGLVGLRARQKAKAAREATLA